MRSHVPVDDQWHLFEQDWFGHPDRYRARYRLSCDAENLVFEFAVDKAPECERSHASGSFVEGLWEQEVAELFVLAGDGRYQEFNLSPTGAWWTASFSGYRQRDQASPLPGVTTEAHIESTTWTARIRIPRSQLLVDLQEAQLSVTAILCPDQPVYLCWGRCAGGEPDFHRADNFRPAQLA